MTVRVFEQHMKEGYPEKMYKTAGNACILGQREQLNEASFCLVY